MQINGGLWAFNSTEIGNRQYLSNKLNDIKEKAVREKLSITDNDPDLPETSTDGGVINQESANFNPG